MNNFFSHNKNYFSTVFPKKKDSYLFWYISHCHLNIIQYVAMKKKNEQGGVLKSRESRCTVVGLPGIIIELLSLVPGWLGAWRVTQSGVGSGNTERWEINKTVTLSKHRDTPCVESRAWRGPGGWTMHFKQTGEKNDR